MDVGWGSLVKDPLDCVSFASFRRMLECGLDVELWCKSPPASSGGSGATVTPGKPMASIKSASYKKIFTDKWGLHKLGLLKPYELTRFIIK